MKNNKWNHLSFLPLMIAGVYLITCELGCTVSAAHANSTKHQNEYQIKISDIDESIREIDKHIASKLNAPIHACGSIGYDRQLRYHELRKQIELEKREILVLQRTILQYEQEHKEVPQDMRKKLARLKESKQSRQLKGEEKSRAHSNWNEIDQILAGDLAVNYNWHIVKLNLLRDLVQRSGRIRFYLEEAAGSTTPEERLAEMKVDTKDSFTLEQVQNWDPRYSIGHYRNKYPIERGLAVLTSRTREWIALYGDCFFGKLEQELLGQFDKSADLLKRALSLQYELVRLEQQRESLTMDVLNILKQFDGDGKFKSIGVPYRSREITIDANGHPSQLLFCTMDAAENRPTPRREYTDALCFDVIEYMFYGVPMESPGVISQEKIDHSMSEYGEEAVPLSKLRTADLKRGYHFKQPALLNNHGKSLMVNPEMLDEEIQKDPDLYLRNSAGVYNMSLPNIWHPEVRKLMVANMSAMARYSREQPKFLFYDKLTWEQYRALISHDSSKSPGMEAGYSKYAVEAFRKYLVDKFITIESLNKSWKSDYHDFASIEPPEDAYIVIRRRATPLSYEFERFRQKSWTDYQTLAAQAIRKEDPGRPIAVEVPTFISHFACGTADSFRMMSDIPAEYIDAHYNNWGAHYSSMQMLNDLCYYAGKIPVHQEQIWTYPRLTNPINENQFRVTGELSFWRNIVWGRQMIHTFGAFDGWGYRHNYMDEEFSYAIEGWILGGTGKLVREAGTALPVAKKRANEFWPYLKHTHVAKPKIAVIVPATSIINDYPYTKPFESYPTISTEMIRYERFLAPLDLKFRFVPEAVIVDGREDLSGFKVVIIPYAPYFPQGLNEKLHLWLKNGGVLISGGACGIYDPYGFDDASLLQNVYGKNLKYKYSGNDRVWKWDFDISQSKNTIEEIQRDGRAVVIHKTYDKGRMVMLTEPISGSPCRNEILSFFTQTIIDTIKWPMVYSDHHSFELIMREDQKGQRYLFATNPHLSENVIDYVTVDGVYEKIVDLGIGSNCSIPLVPREPITIKDRYDLTSEHTDGGTLIQILSPPERTTFQIRLAPGEGTVFALIK